jgi:hypothetical protein
VTSIPEDWTLVGWVRCAEKDCGRRALALLYYRDGGDIFLQMKQRAFSGDGRSTSFSAPVPLYRLSSFPITAECPRHGVLDFDLNAVDEAVRNAGPNHNVMILGTARAQT